jgi:hypothetical protein
MNTDYYVLISQCDGGGSFDENIVVLFVITGDSCILRYASASILFLYLVFVILFCENPDSQRSVFWKGCQFSNALKLCICLIPKCSPQCVLVV